MSLGLNHLIHGYYQSMIGTKENTSDKIGEHGDFITAPVKQTKQIVGIV